MMRAQDWCFIAGGGGAILAIVATLLGHPVAAVTFGVVTACAAVVARVAARRHPGPMSPALGWVLHLPRGPHSSKSLLQFLSPVSGERILEVGPGTGVHSLPIARALVPDGALDAVDIQQEMLEALGSRAAAVGLRNIVPILADAQRLPHPDHTFDAALLITVLGEIPDPDAALRELVRVLKPDGRLIIGEMIADPDFVSLHELKVRARKAGLIFDGRRGASFAYLARFRPLRTV